MKIPFAPIKHIDDELIRKIALGDQKAFNGLYYLYYKRLCQFAFLFNHSKEISKEAVLDVFFNIWMKREQLVTVHNIRSFLYTSVHNQAIKYQQREKPITKDYINVYELEMESPELLVDDMIDRKLFRERLKKAFDELPERCRMITRMHFTDQLQYKEIAEILHISHKTVEAQIAIATKKIKAIFEKYGWNK